MIIWASTFIAPLFSCIIYSSFVYYHRVRIILDSYELADESRFESMHLISLYPLVQTLAWLPVSIVFIYVYFQYPSIRGKSGPSSVNKDLKALFIIVDMIAVFEGICTSLIFLYLPDVQNSLRRIDLPHFAVNCCSCKEGFRRIIQVYFDSTYSTMFRSRSALVSPAVEEKQQFELVKYPLDSLGNVCNSNRNGKVTPSDGKDSEELFNRLAGINC